MLRYPIFGCLVLLFSLALQGCDITVPRHEIGNWLQKVNYLEQYQFILPGSDSKPILNSCSDPAVTSALQCGGHGRCRDWNDLVPGVNDGAKRLAFCECDRDWADPECGTPRKSQQTAFVLSIFFGWLGVDEFYIGYLWYGLFKSLITVVALVSIFCIGEKMVYGSMLAAIAVLWYLYDICRIGSSAVVTRYNFRVAADLPHFVFVLTVVTFMLFIGFLISIRSIQQQRVKKAHELLLLRMEQQEVQEEREEKEWQQEHQPQYSMKLPSQPTTTPLRNASFSGYGAMIPRTVPTSFSNLTSRPVATTLAPVTLPTPPVTLPPAASRQVANLPLVTSTYPPITTASPPVSSSLAPITTPLQTSRSIPITEYSVPRAVLR